MSVIVDEEATCPHCSATQEVKVARSVNGGRSPRLRQAIIDGVFQRPTCDQCGRHFVVESTFSYIDFTRQHLFMCHPISTEADWKMHAAAFEDLVRSEFTWSEVAEVRELGDGVTTRLVFGLEALREKLLCLDAGLDDRVLEAIKLMAISSDHRLRGEGLARLRLVAVDEATVQFATSELDVTLDRAEYESLAASDSQWSSWRARLDGPYVDLGRILGPDSAR